MAGWDVWDYGILAIAVYVAVVTLVRMMARRRDRLLDDLSRGAEQQQRRKPKPAEGKRGEAA